MNVNQILILSMNHNKQNKVELRLNNIFIQQASCRRQIRLQCQYIYGNIVKGTSPAGIWCQNDVVSTSMRRHHVASTLTRRHFTSCAHWDQVSNYVIFGSGTSLSYCKLHCPTVLAMNNLVLSSFCDLSCI